MPEVNDIHSRLNVTEVARVVEPRGPDEVVDLVRAARRQGGPLCIAGGRHAMGGQQFRAGATLIDMRRMNGVVSFDQTRGLLRIGAGASWPTVIRATRDADTDGTGPTWGIRQKQTGADELTIGGAVSCNAHGRGLDMGPIVEDVESLTLVTADGTVAECSRDANAELFALAAGGYGLFGVITDVTLRLSPRRRMRRVVDIIDLDDAIHAVYRRAADGCVYGDFQYAIDPGDDSFLRRGVFACYKPTDDAAPVSGGETDLPREAWLELLRLAHTDKRRAFQVYSEHYIASHGRVYWSDTMQLSTYIPTYAEFLAAGRQGAADESLMISELYVPPEALPEFMKRARMVMRTHGVEDIYGTIRAINKDETTFLPWARERSACVIFNLRTPHDGPGIEKSARAARSLIDAAADLAGTFYLTYHRWATKEQVLRCYPRFPEFLQRKLAHDPTEVFQSDWYIHYRDAFGRS